MSSEWSAEDRALLIAYRAYLATLCSGCGEPKEHAWHPDNWGEYERHAVVTCHACTELRAPTDGKGEVKPVEYVGVRFERDLDKYPYPANTT